MIQSMSLGPVQPAKLLETKPVQEATPAQLTQSFGQYSANGN